MNRLILLLSVMFLIQIAPVKLKAQTYAYKISHSVKDEMKIKAIEEGRIYYFTFTKNKSMCHMSEKDGMALAYDISYEYIGENNGILVYRGTGNYSPWKKDLLYFSANFERLNWRHFSDDINPKYEGAIRVLIYVANPNAVDIPNTFY